MDTKIAGLLGAVTALAAVAPMQGAVAAPVTTASVMQVSSYADLLKPIPNATELLKASDAEAAAHADLLPAAREGDATLEQAQFYDDGYGYHHHHHHYHHHHHFRDGPRFGGPFFHHHHHGYYRRFYRHHHHHHHHHFRDYGY